MHADSLNRAAELPAALSAFLRGAERRAFVFLWLQGGDAATAERELAAAIRAFPGPAARMPMADWPVRFWKLLGAAVPVEAGDAQWPAALGFLAAMPAPARHALLLRQVAGLEEAMAAEAMGLEVSAYRQALAEACPADAAGQPDAAGWRRQAEAIQHAGRDLDAAQLLRLVQLREAALAGQPLPPAARPAHRDHSDAPVGRIGKPGNPRRSRSGLRIAVLIACVLVAVVAVCWWRWPARAPLPGGADPGSARVDDLRVHDNPPVAVEPLPDDSVPPDPGDWPAALTDAPQDPVVAGLARLSWYAAGAPASHVERETDAEAPPEAVPAVAADAAAGTQAEASGGDLADAWRTLDAIEQAQVRAAAAQWQVLSPDEQAALHARFAALDAMERRGWQLGPTLGADYFALQPLVGFVPEGERAPLLAALRALTPEQRAQLGALARRTPPAGREALRAGLLATPPAQRGAWVEQRARQ